MAAFINNDITAAGLIVLAKGVAGEKINYTKIVLGDGYLEEGQMCIRDRDVFDYDVSESARAASALMKNFDLDAEEAYGLIAVGAQNGADKNGDLLDTLNEYSPQFAALGLSADQFIGTLAVSYTHLDVYKRQRGS